MEKSQQMSSGRPERRKGTDDLPRQQQGSQSDQPQQAGGESGQGDVQARPFTDWASI
jgi:hypothetical protein